MAIDPGLGSLTYATEDGTIAKVQIAPSADTDHRAIRRIQRAMERSRRQLRNG
jgi:putative transposase